MQRAATRCSPAVRHAGAVSLDRPRRFSMFALSPVVGGPASGLDRPSPDRGRGAGRVVRHRADDADHKSARPRRKLRRRLVDRSPARRGVRGHLAARVPVGPASLGAAAVNAVGVRPLGDGPWAGLTERLLVTIPALWIAAVGVRPARRTLRDGPRYHQIDTGPLEDVERAVGRSCRPRTGSRRTRR